MKNKFTALWPRSTSHLEMGIAIFSTLGVIVAALFFGALSYGGLVINQRVPKELVEMLTALVILFAIAVQQVMERAARSLR